VIFRSVNYFEMEAIAFTCSQICKTCERSINYFEMEGVASTCMQICKACDMSLFLE
jgi:hypothetical protein